MRILHICLCGLFIPGWSYQENLLTKYQLEDGHDVSVITSKWIYDVNGNYIYKDRVTEDCEEKARIIRLEIKGKHKFSYVFKRYENLYEAIENEHPDIIFLHSPQFLDASCICKYIRNNRNVKLFVDNHADFNNSAKIWPVKYILHGIIWRYKVHQLNNYAEVFYGVTPARVEFLSEMYGLPKERSQLLVLGADSEKIEECEKIGEHIKIRNQIITKSDDILFVTGGKIDSNKPETLALMEAIVKLNNPKIKLLVFGSVAKDLESNFLRLADNKCISYIGWIDSKEVYKYFLAADAILFPGLHSVLWEQAAGTGKACVFRKIDGFTHVDLGGNCLFFDDLSVEGITKTITELLGNNKFKELEKNAKIKCRTYFSYREISRRSIGE